MAILFKFGNEGITGGLGSRSGSRSSQGQGQGAVSGSGVGSRPGQERGSGLSRSKSLLTTLYLRWEPYERSPHRFTKFIDDVEKSVKDIVKFYEAYETYSKLIHSPENNIELALKPGIVLFCDNFRVLHARTAFEVNE